MPEDEQRALRWGSAELPVNDLTVRAANSDLACSHQDITWPELGQYQRSQVKRVRAARENGDPGNGVGGGECDHARSLSWKARVRSDKSLKTPGALLR